MHSIDALKELTKKELLSLWNELPGNQPPPPRVNRLLRELAYRLQNNPSAN